MGAELIRRERGIPHLTELGRIVRPGLERALAMTEAVRAEPQDFSGMSSATLRLGVICAIGPSRLIPIISHLARNVPQPTIELLEVVGPKIVESLINDEIDVALVGMPKYPNLVGIAPLYREC